MYALQSIANGKHVSVTDDGQLIATASLVGIREYFIISENLVTLKSKYNQFYVSIDTSYNDPIVANSDTWEAFEITRNTFDGTISLKSQINDRYIRTETTSNNYLIANQNAISPWEKYFWISTSTANLGGIFSNINRKYVTVTDDGSLVASATSLGDRQYFILSDNYITLKSSYNNKYVRTDYYGNNAIVANSDKNEVFEIINNSDGTVSLKSQKISLYVRAENAGNSYLMASQNAIGTWEKFNLIKVNGSFENTYALQSTINGKYVSVTTNGSLIANSSSIRGQECFIVAKNLITIRSNYNNKYVKTDVSRENAAILKADRWETFEMISNSDYTISFRSKTTNLYVSAENNYLIANGEKIDSWQKFSLITDFTSNICSYQSIVSKKYVSVANNGQLIANASTIGIRETFEVSTLTSNRLTRPNLITLKSSYNNKYISAENGGNSSLIANRDKAYLWETFEIISHNDNTVSLRSSANNKFVSADNNAQDYLIANRIQAFEWEKFKIITNRKNNAFQSIVNGKYVSVADNGQLIANAGSIGIRESFVILLNLITLKSSLNGKYVSAENYGNDPLIANRDAAGVWETYELIPNNDNTFGLISRINNRYVCAENAGNNYLIANGNANFEWDKFNLITDSSTNTTAIQSIVNEKYVSVVDDSKLIANSSTIGVRESFQLSKIDIPAPSLKEYWATIQSIFNSRFIWPDSVSNNAIVATKEQFGVLETFKIIYNYDETISLSSAINGKFVCADNDGQDYLIANGNLILDCEKFNLIQKGNTVALQSITNGLYVSVVDNSKLIANASEIGIQESFVISLYTTQLYRQFKGVLQSYYSLNYVTAESGSLVSYKNYYSDSEMFMIIYNRDNTNSLLSLANNKYVSAEYAGQELTANTNDIGPWEKFSLSYDPTTGLCTFRFIITGKYFTIASNGKVIANATHIDDTERFIVREI